VKNLNKKYKKVRLQRIFCNIRYSYTNKICYEFSGRNLIGFEEEYHYPPNKAFVSNFYDYTHSVDIHNKKLYKKYPKGTLKIEYKQWYYK